MLICKIGVLRTEGAREGAFTYGMDGKHDTYCVLPDGAIFWLRCPEDYQEARMITRDEVGNGNPDQSWSTSVLLQPVVQAPNQALVYCA